MNINIEVNGLDKLQKVIDYVYKLQNMKTDQNFQKFIQQKCLETIDKIAKSQFALIPTTNEDDIKNYLNNNFIRNETSNGFEIYNNYSIYKPASSKSPAYEFSIAMAFEYGVGIIGAENPVKGAWQYDVGGENGNGSVKANVVYINGEEIRGWWLENAYQGRTQSYGVSKSGEAFVTRGYQGLEIYRKSAYEINKNLKSWVYEYFSKKK